METEQKTEPAQNEQHIKADEALWWFEQPEPIARFTGWLGVWTALLFVGTIISAFILLKTDLTLQDTLEATNRAWIAPMEVSIVGQPMIGEKLRSQMQLRNSGQSPALKINYGMQIRKIVEGESFIRDQGLCQRVPYPGNQTLFPSSIPNWQATLVWEACFRYETYGKQRHTTTCFGLRPPGDSWYWHDCGMEAD